MSWFNPNDTTRPVFTAEEHIRGKNLPGIWEALPDRAVVFFLGKGFPVVEEAFPTEEVLASLPGFITHSRVLRVTGHGDVCFVHGGYGAPQAVCTAEALIALGVKEFLLIGLCGAFGEEKAQELIRMTQGRVAIGFVTHFPAQDALFTAFFGNGGE